MNNSNALLSVSYSLAVKALEQALREGRIIEIPSLDIVVSTKPYCIVRCEHDKWTFDTAHEAALFLWGRYLPKYSVYKDGQRVILTSADCAEIEKELEAAGHGKC